MNFVKNPGARNRRALSFAVAAVAFATVASSSAALAAEPPTEVRVSTRDLNLQTPAGAQTLMHRIYSAATLVCGGGPLTLEIADYQSFRRCRADAVARAVRDADAPMVTALAYHGSAPMTLAGS